MKKLGILIALALCITIGGIFTIWAYAQGYILEITESINITVSFLCLVVFTAFAALIAVLIGMLVRLYIRLIRSGGEDELIRAEFKVERKKFRVSDIVNSVIMGIIVIALFSSSIFSLYVYLVEEHAADDVPSIMVVNGSAMAENNAENTYLTEKGLNDQIKNFDLITTKQLPTESALALYDVVVYEKDGSLHPLRIVEINEPDSDNASRSFVLRGDAVGGEDSVTATYGELRGIYRGTRVPFVGSIILFLQSPSGYLCIFLVLFAIIITPFLKKKIYDEKKKRWNLLLEEPKDKKQKSAPEPSIIDELEIFNIKPGSKRDIIMFRDKLRASSARLQSQYVSIVKPLLTVRDIRESYSAQYQTFKQGKTPVARLKVKNGMLYVYLGLDPDASLCHGINVTDVSAISTFADFPVLIKVTDENIDTVQELILVVIEQKHLDTNEE